MRILLYNWVPSNSAITEGGGVALYLSNLVDGLVEAGHAVDVLSSGFRYSLFDARLRVVRRRTAKRGVRYYDVVNSPVAAPSFFMFSGVARVVECPELVATVESFMRRHGPYDVFHIQNIEGLSFDVLTLAERLKTTRFVLTNHNYHVVCQQANLWKQDKSRCTDYNEGAACHTCNVFPVEMDRLVVERTVRLHRLDAPRVGPVARRLLGAVVRARRVVALPAAWDVAAPRRVSNARIAPADIHRLRRHRALDLVNRHCFRVLSVSRATERVLLGYGLSPALSRVSYIGTRHYDPARIRSPRSPAPHLRLAFLGYTRPDKGFHFLADAIEAMPAHLYGRFSLLIAAKFSDPDALGRVQACRDQFADMTAQDGYKQADLPRLLADVDVGLVLPQWDDALPQVAIEFVCNGVAILTTDRGGQQELAVDPHFVFPATSVEAFWARLERLADDHVALERFWEAPRPLRTNAQHVQELLEIYAGHEPAAEVESNDHLSPKSYAQKSLRTGAEPRRSSASAAS